VGGLEPLLLWSIIRALRSQRYPPSDETRVYAERRVLADVEKLSGAIATAVPRPFRDEPRWVEAADGEPAELRGGARLTTFLVDHEPPGAGAMGCMVERDGTRLVYSGDTRPTNRPIEAARGVDVLIHASGGLDAQAAEVHQQGHSTELASDLRAYRSLIRLAGAWLGERRCPGREVSATFPCLAGTP